MQSLFHHVDSRHPPPLRSSRSPLGRRSYGVSAWILPNAPILDVSKSVLVDSDACVRGHGSEQGNLMNFSILLAGEDDK